MERTPDQHLGDRLRAWRDLARDGPARVAEYARAEGRPLHEIEAELRRATGTTAERPRNACPV
ncbi:hypothetical protein GCM10023238_10510 [Streptomyces heliomycini]